MATDKATHMTLYSVTAELHDKVVPSADLMETVQETAKKLLTEAVERSTPTQTRY